MNCLLLSIGILTIIGQVYGRIVSFNLLTFGQAVAVQVDKAVANLTPIDNFSHVHSISVVCPDEDFEYKYFVDGKSEGFVRVLPAGELTTHIEFFGRKNTIQPLVGLGYPPENGLWVRSIGKTALFDDSYIPTVIFDAGSADFFRSGNDTWTLGRFTIVLQDEVFTETNVPTKAQNRYQDKFQFRIKLENKIHKRRVFKFRANPADPTFFRQSLYGDIAAAVGNPVHNQVIVRVYLSDGTPIGLYLMIEVTSSKSFIKTQFYGNPISGKVNAPENLGYPLDCSTGADFNKDQKLGPFHYSEGENNEKIKYLIEAMHSLDINDENAIVEFNQKWFDLNVFFRALALEYLTGDWDSYWMLTTNFVMYDDPLESQDGCYKFYFIDQDFDLTFGIGLSTAINPYGLEYPNKSYKTLIDRTWSIEDYDGPNRAAIDLFLRGGLTKQYFESHLVSIVKHVFNPVALGRRLDQYVDRYAREVEWDYNIERLHIGADPNKTRYVWTMNDFYQNLEDVPKNNVQWGLKDYIKKRATAVAKEFGFEWDSVPLDPVPIETIVANNEEEYNLIEDNSYGVSSIELSTLTSLVLVMITLFFGFLM